MRLLLSNGGEVTAAAEVQLSGTKHATAVDLVEALKDLESNQRNSGNQGASNWVSVTRASRRMGVVEKEVLHLKANEVIGVVEELGEEP